LLHHILSYKKTFVGLAKQFGRKDSLNVIVKKISDEHLHWAFGVLPLISDIQKLTELLATWRKVIDELYRGHSRTFKYQSLDITPEWSSKADLRIGDQWIGDYKGVGGSWLLTCRVSAEWKGYLRYFLRAGDEIRRPFGSFLGLLDLLGVQADPGIIYDAIPFSFVLDWFSDLGDNIHALEKPLISVSMTVTDAMHHVKVGYSRDFYYLPEGSTGSPVYMFSSVVDSFVRRRYLPAQIKRPSTLKRLGVDKLLLGLALIGSR
jgi:hypothetical protein